MWPLGAPLWPSRVFARRPAPSRPARPAAGRRRALASFPKLRFHAKPFISGPSCCGRGQGRSGSGDSSPPGLPALGAGAGRPRGPRPLPAPSRRARGHLPAQPRALPASIINRPRSRRQETRARGARRARPDGGGRGAGSGRRAPWTQVRAPGGSRRPAASPAGAPTWPWDPSSGSRDAGKMLGKVRAT